MNNKNVKGVFCLVRYIAWFWIKIHEKRSKGHQKRGCDYSSTKVATEIVLQAELLGDCYLRILWIGLNMQSPLDSISSRINLWWIKMNHVAFVLTFMTCGSKAAKQRSKTGEAQSGGQRFTSYLLISQESLRSITRRFVHVDLNITSHLINHHFKTPLLC